MSIMTYLRIDSTDEWSFFLQQLQHDQIKILAIHRLGLLVTGVGYTREMALEKVHKRIEHLKIEATAIQGQSATT